MLHRFITAYKFYRQDCGRRTHPSYRLPRWRALLGAWRFARNGLEATDAALKSFRVADRIYAALYKHV